MTCGNWNVRQATQRHSKCMLANEDLNLSKFNFDLSVSQIRSFRSCLSIHIRTGQQNCDSGLSLTIILILADSTVADTGAPADSTRKQLDARIAWVKSYDSSERHWETEFTDARTYIRPPSRRRNTKCQILFIAAWTDEWLYVGWQWRNFVPYLCQLAFGAML